MPPFINPSLPLHAEAWHAGASFLDNLESLFVIRKLQGWPPCRLPCLTEFTKGKESHGEVFRGGRNTSRPVLLCALLEK
jgi:hypothetical protein